MYLRFIVLTPHRRPAPGIFSSAFDSENDRSLPEWLRTAAQSHYDWFNENLPLPARLSVVSKRRHVYAGICWFQPSAREHIARARELAWLIDEAGFPTRELKSRRIGQILYRDSFQIVAKPEPDTHAIWTNSL